ncbi:DNA helicase B-like, partial [Saccoglossus kowalevskii]|uniref:DNA helicase B-like n=1 Tax=Saccoglossus kowalevskii TaxID=10224 RepID=A0ABM0LZB9_SACKO
RIYNIRTKKTITVHGGFISTGPWWETQIKVGKKGRNVRFMIGYPSYKLRQNATEDIVALFLTKGCEIDGVHVHTFTETIKQMGLKLNFADLEETVSRFEKVKEEYVPIAAMIRSSIMGTAEGMLVLKALKFNKLLWYLPKLLPKHAVNILSNKDDEHLEKLETVMVEEPWTFGFSQMLRHYRVIGCEATLESYNQCDLIKEMPQNSQDALYIYHVLKFSCQKYGHTFLFELSLKRSKAFQGYRVKNWKKAYEFLEEHNVIVREENRVYLKRYWCCERNIARYLTKLQANGKWEIEFDWAGHLDFQDDPEQQQAAKLMCLNPITVMSGKGGCGKTHVVSIVFKEAEKRFLKMNEEETGEDDVSKETEDFDGKNVDESYEQEVDTPNEKDEKNDSGPKGPHILLTAPTGKAASLLGRRTKLPSFTLHQVMYSFYHTEKDEYGKPKDWKYSNVHALIVDESSMVSVQVFSTVLKFLMEYSKLEKIVFLGDINQLPSIDPGNFLSDLYKAYSLLGCSISLLTNHRTESALIVKNATQISNQWMPVFDSNHGFHEVTVDSMNDVTMDTSTITPTQEETESFSIDEAVRRLLRQKDESLQDHTRSQFVAFRRNDCDRINELCCKHYAGHLTKTAKNRLDFREGDKICMTKNASVFDIATESPVRLCNGEIFFIKEYVEQKDAKNRKTSKVTLDDGERSVCVDFGEVKRRCKVKHAWARTIHTYQGSESETVIYLVGGKSPYQNWQHVYTAVTRGKCQVYVVSSKSQLCSAINKKPDKRNTRLYALLSEKQTDGSESVNDQSCDSNVSMVHRKRLFAKDSEMDTADYGCMATTGSSYWSARPTGGKFGIAGTLSQTQNVEVNSQRLEATGDKFPTINAEVQNGEDWDEDWSDEFGDKLLAFEQTFLSTQKEQAASSSISSAKLTNAKEIDQKLSAKSNPVQLPAKTQSRSFRDFRDVTTPTKRSIFCERNTQKYPSNLCEVKASEIACTESSEDSSSDDESILTPSKGRALSGQSSLPMTPTRNALSSLILNSPSQSQKRVADGNIQSPPKIKRL